MLSLTCGSHWLGIVPFVGQALSLINHAYSSRRKPSMQGVVVLVRKIGMILGICSRTQASNTNTEDILNWVYESTGQDIPVPILITLLMMAVAAFWAILAYVTSCFAKDQTKPAAQDRAGLKPTVFHFHGPTTINQIGDIGGSSVATVHHSGTTHSQISLPDGSHTPFDGARVSGTAHEDPVRRVIKDHSRDLDQASITIETSHSDDQPVENGPRRNATMA